MLLVAIVCSDPGCIEEREVVVEDLAGVDEHLCDCGHGFVVVSVAEADHEPRAGAVIELPERRGKPSRRAA